MTYTVVSAKEVEVGDRIYGGGRSWWTVLSVGVLRGYIAFETAAWTTYKHPDEAMAVQRDLTSAYERMGAGDEE